MRIRSPFASKAIDLTLLRTAPLTAWLVLGLMLLLTLLAVLFVRQQDARAAGERFDQEVARIQSAVSNHLGNVDLLLRSGGGIFALSPAPITRAQWDMYVDQLHIGTGFAGVYGLGFIEMDQRGGNAAQAHVRFFDDDRRREPTDAVFPGIAVEQPLRDAMARARDSGQAAVSAMVGGHDTPAGAAARLRMYWPVYHEGVPTATTEERRRALRGYVFAPLALDEMVYGIVGNVVSPVELTIEDVSDPAHRQVLFGTVQDTEGNGGDVPAFTKTATLGPGGRRWQMTVSSTPAFRGYGWDWRQIVALAVVGQLSILIFLLQLGNIRARRRDRELSSEIERHARLREERFRLVVEASPSAIIVTTAEGKIELVNAQVEKLFGYRRDELLGQSVEILIPQQFRAKHPELRARFAATPATRPMGAGRDLFALTKDGRDIPIEIGLNPIHTEDGLLILSSIIDISERKAAEARLREQTEQIAAASRYKSEFLANMSHELRTPLNSILILSEQLIANAQGNLLPKQVSHADIIHRSGRDLLGLINDILDLSKIEAGRMSLVLETIYVVDLAASVEHAFHLLAESKNIAFSVNVDPDVVPVIESDHQRIFQIIRNLFSNALKFTREGAIDIRFYTPRPSAAEQRRPRETLAIEVRDSGIGIPQDKHKMIFDAFQQVDGSTSRRYGGTGLGLTISRQLAELLGGDITLSSEPGKGSTFTLHLPARSELQDSVRTGLPGSAALPGAPPSVVVIENDPQLAQVIAREARSHGMTPHVVRTAAEGLHLVQTVRPSAVILDMRLPNTNGWAVLRELRLQPECRDVPIQVISDDTQASLMFDGAIGYFVKPIAAAQLGQALAELDSRPRAAGKRVLLVEDNQVECESYAETIGNLGYDVITASGAQDALKCCRERAFDCLVIDLNLPDMSGFELLERLKAENLVRHAGVIINTGMELDSDKVQTLRQYSAVVVTKTAGESKLIDALRGRLQELAPSRAPAAAMAVSAGTDAAAPADAAVLSPGLAGKHVLVVDDDVRNIYAMCSMLEALGLETETTKNGEEALRFLQQHAEIDLVLMDMMMPVMDGYAATAELKFSRHYTKPIVALTAHAMKGDREKCLEAGADDYLAKPVTNDALLNILNKWLG